MTEVTIPLHAIKGRGTATRLAHRFEKDARAAYDDGWGTLEEAAGNQAPIATEVVFEDARSAICRNDSPDIYFDYSVNPYRGCEHGCIYCYARPTHSYLNLSPGLDFETKIIAKRNIAAMLRADLGKRSYLPKLINIGSATDCYQPVERELRLTRGLIELMQEVRHPLALVTKSSGVERDLDLLAPMAAQHLAAVYVTITTLDGELARKLEPRAAAPHRRLRTIRALADAGVPVGVSVAPQIPFVNDDMEQVLQAAFEAGARTAFYTVVRLPWEVAPLFKQWLALHYPQRADRIMARIQEMRGGKDYDSDFASRMKGSGMWADLIKQRFEKTCHRLGLNRQRTELDFSQFRPPVRPSAQGSLF
ncbi:MAG: PA0069 family radical SAM protein [Polaromonas sp.]|uniref:PA0069 family radical SAM protein n=1 Tax=Comamonadaceae TaxID=80864 RepID=UPI00272F3ECC|nr:MULTISPECIES: PA0069 family radical SAM protein [Comamonadaceae]MDP2441810.1 PA0069 family radical SAM protein [Rhodoferax sp.]MDP3249879.1 PA0069 family radical SAM protein [Polaromonas sp.]MDP3756954.1 PA0069 family radical SAM protein [Polaromonas sp.]